ncbi:hypothetical protein B7463_g2161, partial [Scytalidium lignicola]
MLSTTEGFEYSPLEGIKAGLATPAVIAPGELNASTKTEYDMIVVGAGHAGLTATRDLTAQGRKVLLVEARDRIGGRTWTSFKDAQGFEMGGTWIHWHQPHVWAEVTRYGLNDQIKDSLEYFEGCIPYATFKNGVQKDWSIEELGALQTRTQHIFHNPDGKNARDIVPYPHNPTYNQKDFARYDQMSGRDRINQLKEVLTDEELRILEGTLVAMAGPLEDASFFDLIQRWVLGGAEYQEYVNHMARYKLKCGQSGLARHIFDDCCLTGKLCYSFSTVVKSIDSSNPKKATVACSDGRVFSAQKIICTIPLTVLRTISFNPPLSALKAEAVATSGSNPIRKLHAEVEGRRWRSYGASSFTDGNMMMGMGDSFSASGDDTHMVFFFVGGKEDPVQRPHEQLEGVESVHPDFKVKHLIFTDWNNDPLANGSWCFFQPEYMSKYLGALQEQLGNLKFASGDYSDGWRGFIDGAIESGTLAAREVEAELKSAGLHLASATL